MNMSLKIRKTISWILLPAMILYTFAPCFAYGEMINEKSLTGLTGLTRTALCGESALPQPTGETPVLHYSTLNTQRSTFSTGGTPVLHSSVNGGFSINDNPFRYSGYYQDSESNMYYLKARYYSPKNNVFTSRDTYDLPNRFGYCDENPVMGTDPDGHMADWLAKTFGCVAGIGAGMMLCAFPGFAALSPVAAGVISGMIGGGIGYAAEELSQGNGKFQNFSATNLGLSIGFGAFGGLAGCALGRIARIGVEEAEIERGASSLAGLTSGMRTRATSEVTGEVTIEGPHNEDLSGWSGINPSTSTQACPAPKPKVSKFGFEESKEEYPAPTFTRMPKGGPIYKSLPATQTFDMEVKPTVDQLCKAYDREIVNVLRDPNVLGSTRMMAFTGRSDLFPPATPAKSKGGWGGKIINGLFLGSFVLGIAGPIVGINIPGI